jgi:nickel-dependent lactate racemase
MIISHSEIQTRVSSFLSDLNLQDKRVLLVIPDATRTAPVGDLFKVIHENLASIAKDLDVMVALGTHKAMSESEICSRLEITLDERNSTYGKVKLLNHEWDNPEALQLLGTIPAAEISELSGGLFSMDVDVTFNKTALTYDQILILGPVFPHEVVGFSGGNKYLFPGIGGPEILNFFHWLGAVISNAKIIGNGPTPVRKVVDRAAQLVPVEKAAICMVVSTKNELVGLFCDTPEDAWRDAAAVSNEVHIVRKPKAFKTVLSRCPLMYDDLWEMAAS